MISGKLKGAFTPCNVHEIQQLEAITGKIRFNNSKIQKKTKLGFKHARIRNLFLTNTLLVRKTVQNIKNATLKGPLMGVNDNTI